MEEILHHLGCFSDPENKGQISTGTRRIPEPSSVIFFDFRKSKRGGFFFFTEVQQMISPRVIIIVMQPHAMDFGKMVLYYFK